MAVSRAGGKAGAETSSHGFSDQDPYSDVLCFAFRSMRSYTVTSGPALPWAAKSSAARGRSIVSSWEFWRAHLWGDAGASGICSKSQIQRPKFLRDGLQKRLHRFVPPRGRRPGHSRRPRVFPVGIASDTNIGRFLENLADCDVGHIGPRRSGIALPRTTVQASED